MILDSTERPGRGQRALTVLAWMVFVGLCMGPHLHRLGHPSLFADDVTRIVQLRAFPLDRLLFLPFNEHMSPLFQCLSWLTWRLGGEQLVRAPLAFTLVITHLGLLIWETRHVSASLAFPALKPRAQKGV